MSHCPRSGSHHRLARHAPWVLGLASIAWFLIRVVPKPSRASYPCQQAAIATASGFLAWLLGLASSTVLLRQALRSRGWRAGLFAASMVAAIGTWMLVGMPEGTSQAAPPWTPTDPPNTPMGVARGIFPGRVVWSHSPGAALWDGNNGHWWDPASNDQAKIDGIVSSAVRTLTGQATEAAAWNTLFVDFNQRHGKGAVGHAAGELIVVKINQNPARDGMAVNGTPDPNQIVGHPNLIISLVRSLGTAGIDPSDVMIYDASRYIADSIYVPLKAAFPTVRVMQENAGGGREGAAPNWTENAITYPNTPENQVTMTALATAVVNAKYMINMAILKTHGGDVATLCGKNHWGTTPRGRDHYWINGDRPMGSYNPIVNMLGSKHLGGKTVLWMIDAIYSANGSDSGPSRWNIVPFNGGWPNSLFVSQDGVALDSVGFDFANANWGLPHNTDNYLHEAAQANNPPSGTLYAPDGDGVRLPSLGAHEHWNNATDKKYSRNLNPATGTGIELVYVNGEPPPPPVCGDGACSTGETCDTCAQDCGVCPPPPECGDGTCNGTETCGSCEADCGICAPTTRYEAEDSVFVNGAAGADAAASGGEYVDGNEGANFSWTVDATGGAVTLSFATRALDRSMGVFVNGVQVGTITTTTDRPAWAVQTATATLEAGTNTIELRDTEGAAEPDVDYLEVISAVAPACGDGACSGGETCVSCEADCGACPGCTVGELCDGVCVDTATSGQHCGACGNACALGTTCVGGACACQVGLDECGGTCVDLEADAANCGACGNACAAGQFCSLGACGGACAADLTACGQDCVDLTTNPLNCGACGAACPAQGGIASCGAGVCALACSPGQIDLDRNPVNGCEYACVANGAEVCNALDDDCDGVPDDGITCGQTGGAGAPGATPAEENDGCACRAAGGASRSNALLGLVLFAGILARRRRRDLKA
jgi:MYXO-CTERM domain-containing protein